jgi:hypothetical protein
MDTQAHPTGVGIPYRTAPGRLRRVPFAAAAIRRLLLVLVLKHCQSFYIPSAHIIHTHIYTLSVPSMDSYQNLNIYVSLSYVTQKTQTEPPFQWLQLPPPR